MYTVISNNEFSDINLDIILEKYVFGRYLEDKSFDSIQSKAYLKDTLLDYVKNGVNEYLIAFDKNKDPQGILLYRESKWDTDHFGYNVAIIDHLITRQENYTSTVKISAALLSSFDNWSQEKNIRFVSVKIPSQDLAVLHAVENKGFIYIENWIYNNYDLKNLKEENKGELQIRYGNDLDKEFMIKYSKGAFNTHRFHADTRIDVKKADSLYEKWIISAFDDPQQKVAVYDHEGIPTAFMIYYISDLTTYFKCKFAMWKMGLVNPELGHKGIGNKFVQSLFTFHKDENLDIIDSGLSIRNLPSLNWHNKLNFKITSTLVTFHKWYN